MHNGILEHVTQHYAARRYCGGKMACHGALSPCESLCCWLPRRQYRTPEQSRHQVAILSHPISKIHAQGHYNARRWTHPSSDDWQSLSMAPSRLQNPLHMFLAQDTIVQLRLREFTALIASTWSIGARSGTWYNPTRRVNLARVRTAIPAKRGTSI